MENQKNEKNVVYVGDKELVAYTTAVIIQMNRNTNVVISARGKNISRAVDVLEISKRNLGNSVKVESITTRTDMLKRDNIEKPVSVIEIKIVKTRLII